MTDSRGYRSKLVLYEEAAIAAPNIEQLFFDRFIKRCVNRHVAEPSYLNPHLYELAKKAQEEGKKYFYTKKLEDGTIVEAEPVYIYEATFRFTEEEFEKLKSKKEIK